MSFKHRSRGFTLIEVMIAVMIVGVLTAVAYPSYQDHVRRTSRSAAQQFMMDIASRQQQVLLDQRSYVTVTTTANFPNAPGAGGLSLEVPSSTSGKYNFSVDAPATTASAPMPTFTITATAINRQVVDGNLTLNSAGAKTPAAKW